MNKNNLKLIMELIFIFILPLLFICFTSEIQVEREFTYDNQGNYETSADTKKLSFDNSIIKYTKTINKNVTTITHYTDWTTLNNETIYIKYEDWDTTGTYIQNYIALLDGKDVYTIYINFLGGESIPYLYYYGDGINEEYIGEEITYNNEIYYKFENVNSYSNDVWDFNYGFYKLEETQGETITINTIWGNIKELLIENLDLNDNVLLDIVLCYTILWVIMFLIWHLLYGFLELLFHVIPSRWKEGNLR